MQPNKARSTSQSLGLSIGQYGSIAEFFSERCIISKGPDRAVNVEFRAFPGRPSVLERDLNQLFTFFMEGLAHLFQQGASAFK